MGFLARKVPIEVGQILLHPNYRQDLIRNGVPLSLLRNDNQIRRLPSYILEAISKILLAESPKDLARIYVPTSNLATMFQSLPHVERARLFASACKDLKKNKNGSEHSFWSLSLLDTLPYPIPHK